MHRFLSSIPLLAFAIVLAAGGRAQAQHEGDIAVVATGGGGGQLVALGNFGAPLLVKEGFCAAGSCLYSATDPGFVVPSPTPQGYFALTGGTAVQLEVVSIGPAASVKVGAAVLDATGESALLGSAPSLHVHPSWQLVLPKGALEQRSVSLRLRANGSNYAASDTFTLLLSTYLVATTTTTTSTTSTSSTSTTTFTTTSTTQAAFCGDQIVDHGAGEACDAGFFNGTRGQSCAETCQWESCGDADHNGVLAAGDALFVLRVAVGTASCDACLCDVRITAPNQFAASDALTLLRKAVGIDVALQCPPCGD